MTPRKRCDKGECRRFDLERENERLLAALLLLTGNPHIDLGDLVYQVREREGKGWDGPAVLAWSQGVTSAKAAIAKAGKT